MSSKNWQDKAYEACSIRDASLVQDTLLSEDELANLPLNVTGIPRSCRKLSDFELEVTEAHDATALLKLLVSSKVSAKDVLRAFRKRATIAQQLVNCITELLPEAVADAEACDDYLEKHGKPIGPLHGIPISIKEQFSIGGHRTNGGFVSRVDDLIQEDCTIVKTLKSMGAVIFARTMEPQSLMHLESSNNIYGTCVSPFDRNLTPGGSSGGEAALMAMSATMIGIGGDIGGSIRCPAAFCGIYGFKPTARIISTEGVADFLPGSDSILGCIGPFTRSKRDLDLVMTAYTSTLPWLEDPSLAIFPYTTKAVKSPTKKLRIGVMSDDGIQQPLSPVQIVLDDAVLKLRQSAGIEIVSFKPFNHDEAWRILLTLYFEDGGAAIRKEAANSGEHLLPLTSWILGSISSACATPGTLPTVAELQANKCVRDAYRKVYSSHWNSSHVDVVFMPVGPGPSPPHGSSKYWGYTSVWNLLDYPAVSFPASALLKSKSGVDLPVGLQLVAKRWQDNELLAALGVVEEALQS